MSKPDYLTEDRLVSPDQKFLCISFLKQDNVTLKAVKIRGAFENYDAACNHAKLLQSTDPYHHVFVGEMGKWLPFDPEPDSQAVKDSVYANEQLNNMMQSYMENQEKSKVYHEHRKNEMISKNLLDNMNTKIDTMKELKDKLSKSSETERKDLEHNINLVEEQIKKLNVKKEEVDNQLVQMEKTLKLGTVVAPDPPRMIDL
jgi:hypothetical protein